MCQQFRFVIICINLNLFIICTNLSLSYAHISQYDSICHNALKKYTPYKWEFRSKNQGYSLTLSPREFENTHNFTISDIHQPNNGCSGLFTNERSVVSSILLQTYHQYMKHIALLLSLGNLEYIEPYVRWGHETWLLVHIFTNNHTKNVKSIGISYFNVL